jgi:tRNA 5-methylaminomethyl-2-thiouridine biosynthesis bifunctional protein
LSWSALAAETLASDIEAEPAPLSHALLDAIDPGRFVLKALRRGAL